MLNLTVPVYATVLCGIIIYRSHSGRRLLLVTAIGVVLCGLGLVALLYGATAKSVLYQVVFGSRS
jgi:hypothetical protein